jgi:hypothetical protein
MPIDLASVHWLYVIVLAIFVVISTGVANLITFNNRGAAAVLSAVIFAILFVLWTYYPVHVPFFPRTLTPEKAAVTTPAPMAPAAPAAPVKPTNPIQDITPPKQ